MSQYTVYITPTAWDEVQELPGHMRQRVRRAIAALADEPRPTASKVLARPIQHEADDDQDTARNVDKQPLDLIHELRRIRLDRWRIVYAITEADQAIDVLTVRKRPPYDYGDLERLLSEI
ncbi:MAG: type II toxin-antitoxin system RelE/ParE family toxin [Chloroflexota bacterium]|nr:type II toxin-antitoxin system RelE/ParE family toxin [Chloroflexota bacterium]